MNSIPLIKGNTPQEINTSIIALKKALSELEAQDRLLQGTDKDVQDKIKQINELIEGINTHLGTVDTHLTAIDGQITALQPVDTVTSGNMHSVTSNAVAGAISSAIDKLIHIATSETITDGETKQFTLAQNTPYLFMNTHLNHCELIIFINFYYFNYITTYRIFNSNSTEMTNFTKVNDNVIEITAPSNCRGSIWRLGQTLST